MPIITVQMIEGRTDEQRASLIQELTLAANRAIDAPPESVRVVLVEIPSKNWGVGGQTAKVLRAAAAAKG
jgi:4-oxalocrotonate tautomerase